VVGGSRVNGLGWIDEFRIPCRILEREITIVRCSMEKIAVGIFVSSECAPSKLFESKA